MNIADLHNTKSGPVALLGSGPSINDLNLYEIREEMPFIGINDSWKFWPELGMVRVFVDWPTQGVGFAPPEMVIFAEDGSKKRPLPFKSEECPVNWRVRKDGRAPCTFHGFELDEGTDAAFSGMLALEFAVWVGYNPITLLGFDCIGAHCYDDEKTANEKTHVFWRKLLKHSISVCKERGVNVLHR